MTHSASAESAIPTKGHWSYLSDMWAKGRDDPVARSRCAIPDPPKVYVVDEFSIEKGHKYAKLVIDSKEKEMLYLHRGKSKEDFRPFFKEHDSSWYKGIEGCMNKKKVIKRTAFGFRDFDYFFDRIWYAFLPRHKKMEARRKVWECYEMDFSELSAETIEQQKTG